MHHAVMGVVVGMDTMDTNVERVWRWEMTHLAQDDAEEIRPDIEVGKGKKAKQIKDQTQTRIHDMKASTETLGGTVRAETLN